MINIYKLALDAIAALSDITIESNSSDTDRIGLRLTFDSNDERVLEPIARNKGTTVIVQNLFSPYPPRRMYLLQHQRKQEEELHMVAASFAMSLDLNIALSLDNKMVIQSSGGSREKRVRSILGQQIAKGIISGNSALDEWCPNSNLEFFASTPTSASNGQFILIVNSRPCFNHALQKAVNREFKLCGGPKTPTVVLFIDTPIENFRHVPDSPFIGIDFKAISDLQSSIARNLHDG